MRIRLRKISDKQEEERPLLRSKILQYRDTARQHALEGLEQRNLVRTEPHQEGWVAELFGSGDNVCTVVGPSPAPPTAGVALQLSCCEGSVIG